MHFLTIISAGLLWSCTAASLLDSPINSYLLSGSQKCIPPRMKVHFLTLMSLLMLMTALSAKIIKKWNGSLQLASLNRAAAAIGTWLIKRMENDSCYHYYLSRTFSLVECWSRSNRRGLLQKSSELYNHTGGGLGLAASWLLYIGPRFLRPGHKMEKISLFAALCPCQDRAFVWMFLQKSQATWPYQKSKRAIQLLSLL